MGDADDLKIIPYNIQEHGEQVQDLVNKYLIPTYLKRMGLHADELTDKYYLAEEILHPRGAMDEKFVEGLSFVAVDKSNRVLGCHLSYYVTKDQFNSHFVENNYKVMKDKSYKESVRKYCQHCYFIWRDCLHLYDSYHMEKLLYLESVILHPDIRGRGTDLKLEFSSIRACNERHGILVDGMWPIMKLLEVLPDFLADGVVGDVKDLGFILLERTISYDGYVVPVFFKPPNNSVAAVKYSRL